MTLPLRSDSQQKAVMKMKKILKEYVPELGNSFPENLKDFKNMEGFGMIPSFLILHFNIIMPDMFDDIVEEDDADWWKR